VTATPLPLLRYVARLDPSNTGPDWAGSWFITHGLGKAAEGTYTEVGWGQGLRNLPEHVIEDVVRRVAVELYGTAWAFIYRPDQYEDAIARHGLRRRERVIVCSVEVWS
jgi:hypothetical protein